MKKHIILLLLLITFIWSANCASAAKIKNITTDNITVEEANDAFSQKFQEENTTSSNRNLSVIEELFNGKDADLSANYLKQVGYNLFVSQAINTATTGKFDNSYKLSVGEKVSIYLYGDSVDVMAISGASLLSPVMNSQVDSKGNIFVQGIGVIPAENKSISEVESEMNKIATAKYKNLKVKLNVAGGQDFSVFVYGQVNKPGKVVINNNSSIIDALSAAGGVKKTGTLRKIKYTSGKKTKEVDLYKAFFAGEDDNIILQANDKIFVGGISNIAAIKNGVANIGIYEIKDGESLEKLISYAGGILPTTQDSEVVLSSLNKKTLERSAKNISWTEAKNIKLANGDSVEFRAMYNTAENIVTLQGNIKHPATFAYKEGMKLSDILKDKKELLEETFTTQAVIRRISPEDNSVETIPIFLKEFFAGVNDPVLQPKDIINIYKNTNSKFVDVYGCISRPKQLTYTENMHLDAVLTDVQFIETTVNTNAEQEVDVALNQENDVVLTGGATKNSRVISAENVAVEIISKNEDVQIYYLYDIMINSNAIKSIELKPYDKVFFRPLRNNEMIKNVKITGFVNNPTSYKFVEGKRLKDMIEMAGGLTKDADLRGIVYIRKNLQSKQTDLAKKNAERDIKLLEGRLASGYKQEGEDIEAKSEMIEMIKAEQKEFGKKYSGQIALNIKNNNLDKIKNIDNIEVQDGDEIYIPRLSNHVSVIGEVYNEQSFVYRKGSKAKTYINEVGGYTPNANKFRLYKVGVNGRAEKISKGSRIEAGDTIIVPRKIAGNDWIGPITKTLTGIAAILTSVFVVTKI